MVACVHVKRHARLTSVEVMPAHAPAASLPTTDSSSSSPLNNFCSKKIFNLNFIHNNDKSSPSRTKTTLMQCGKEFNVRLPLCEPRQKLHIFNSYRNMAIYHHQKFSKLTLYASYEKSCTAL